MIHKRKLRKLGRKSAHRSAMLANQATSLFRHGRIKTTLAKSKELRRIVEPLITLAKDDTLHARRQVARVIRDKGIVKKLFTEIAQDMKDRPGGYTQIFRLETRLTDGAPMAYIQLTGYVPPED
ncbi:MAG TPA: 50S ribosomal protein L17 [bacterium]|nr:50S ribosomal protein L17 [Candidatus Omnitrophota bacterium]HOJ60538.1 50S ribosomal protein L17 [bacterium]HOL96841.1 50S ribosomal protein L17 [bacterium]HPP02479.1 50S ribosomal protein L17 [bacterium]HXK92653.1 50S ribosomal protein L17 [bacterium]